MVSIYAFSNQESLEFFCFIYMRELISITDAKFSFCIRDLDFDDILPITLNYFLIFSYLLAEIVLPNMLQTIITYSISMLKFVFCDSFFISLSGC